MAKHTGGILLSTAERRVLQKFSQFLMSPGEMLCISGPDLERDKTTLELLIKKQVLVKEKFKGGYSLTATGYAAMKLENLA